MLINLSNATIAVTEKTLLSDVDFHVSEGEFVYIIGHVGSGKSSLLKTLYGELPVAGEGEATIFRISSCFGITRCSATSTSC